MVGNFNATEAFSLVDQVLPADITGINVLQMLAVGHIEQHFYVLHLDVLLFCLQFPHVRRVPLLDRRTRIAGVEQSFAVFTTTDSGYSIWPCVKVNDEDCCVLELLGLLQFAVIPRNPQHVKPKCVNWGYDLLGRVRTDLHRAGRVPPVGINSDSSNSSDDE